MILLADPHANIVQETVCLSDAAEVPEVANAAAAFAPNTATVASSETLYSAATTEVDANMRVLWLTAKSLA
jgi:hypothetical protein